LDRKGKGHYTNWRSSRAAAEKLTTIQVFSVLLSGLGIGWLCGLSWSPVIAGVITSLLAVASGVVSTLGGF